MVYDFQFIISFLIKIIDNVLDELDFIIKIIIIHETIFLFINKPKSYKLEKHI